MRRKISLIKNILLSNYLRLSSPYKVTLALTYRCNLKCRICKIWNKSLQRELGVQEIEKIFKSLNNLNWVDLTGGEVSLKEEIIEVIKAIIRNSNKIQIFHISTNGQLTEKVLLMAKEILKFGITPVINLSIDGPRDLNDQLRGVNGAFANSLETFKSLRKIAKGYYYISCTISNYNIHRIDDLLMELRKEIPAFNFADIHFNIFHSSSHYYNNIQVDGSVGLDLEVIKKYLTFSAKGNILKSFLENEYLKGLSRFMCGDKFPVKCQALNASCFIDPSGKVYPCGIYDKCVYSLNDFDYDLNRIWSNQDTLEARKKIESKACPGCWSPCEAYPAILGSLLRRIN